MQTYFQLQSAHLCLCRSRSSPSAVGSRCQIAKAEIPLSRGQAIENFLMAAHFNRCVAQGYAESNSCKPPALPLPAPSVSL